MEFRLKKTSYFVTDEEKIKYEKLGFRFRKYRLDWDDSIKWTAKEQPPLTLNIGSLGDLMAFIREWGRIIIDIDEEHNTIEIYDYYRE